VFYTRGATLVADSIFMNIEPDKAAAVMVAFRRLDTQRSSSSVWISDI